MIIISLSNIVYPSSLSTNERMQIFIFIINIIIITFKHFLSMNLILILWIFLYISELNIYLKMLKSFYMHWPVNTQSHRETMPILQTANKFDVGTKQNTKKIFWALLNWRTFHCLISYYRSLRRNETFWEIKSENFGTIKKNILYTKVQYPVGCPW